MAKIDGVWDNNESWYEQNKDRVIDLNEFSNQYPDLEANTLLLTKSEKAGHAHVTYVSPKRNVFEAEFGLKDNSYLLLFQLATNPKYIFATKEEFAELGKKLKETGDHTDTTDHYSRIRYAMSFLRDKLGFKKHKNEDPFVSKKGFGLMCNTIIKM